MAILNCGLEQSQQNEASMLLLPSPMCLHWQFKAHWPKKWLRRFSVTRSKVFVTFIFVIFNWMVCRWLSPDLGGRIKVTKLFTGSYLQATRVPPTSDPVAMAAAVMRPGKPRSMNINDLHHALGHAHEATIRETAKQMGIHVTGTQGYCDGCAEAKAIKSSVPKSVDPSRKSTRPLQRVFIDLAGPYPASTGGSRYCMMVVDDFSNFGWPVFMRDKVGPPSSQLFVPGIKP